KERVDEDRPEGERSAVARSEQLDPPKRDLAQEDPSVDPLGFDEVVHGVEALPFQDSERPTERMIVDSRVRVLPEVDIDDEAPPAVQGARRLAEPARGVELLGQRMGAQEVLQQ